MGAEMNCPTCKGYLGKSSIAQQRCAGCGKRFIEMQDLGGPIADWVKQFLQAETKPEELKPQASAVPDIQDKEAEKRVYGTDLASIIEQNSLKSPGMELSLALGEVALGASEPCTLGKVLDEPGVVHEKDEAELLLKALSLCGHPRSFLGIPQWCHLPEHHASHHSFDDIEGLRYRMKHRGTFPALVQQVDEAAREMRARGVRIDPKVLRELQEKANRNLDEKIAPFLKGQLYQPKFLDGLFLLHSDGSGRMRWMGMDKLFEEVRKVVAGQGAPVILTSEVSEDEVRRRIEASLRTSSGRVSCRQENLSNAPKSDTLPVVAMLDTVRTLSEKYYLEGHKPRFFLGQLHTPTYPEFLPPRHLSALRSLMEQGLLDETDVRMAHYKGYCDAHPRPSPSGPPKDKDGNLRCAGDPKCEAPGSYVRNEWTAPDGATPGGVVERWYCTKHVLERDKRWWRENGWGTVTGRLSGSAPNRQELPKNTPSPHYSNIARLQDTIKVLNLCGRASKSEDTWCSRRRGHLGDCTPARMEDILSMNPVYLGMDFGKLEERVLAQCTCAEDKSACKLHNDDLTRYINDAKTPEERAQRKAFAFGITYGAIRDPVKEERQEVNRTGFEHLYGGIHRKSEIVKVVKGERYEIPFGRPCPYDPKCPDQAQQEAAEYRRKSRSTAERQELVDQVAHWVYVGTQCALGNYLPELAISLAYLYPAIMRGNCQVEVNRSHQLVQLIQGTGCFTHLKPTAPNHPIWDYLDVVADDDEDDED